MNTVLSVLFLILLYEPYDSSSFRISEYICRNLWQIESITIAQVAESCYCSPSAVTKVIRRTGSSSWGRFKERLLRSEKTRVRQLNEKMEKLNEELLICQIQNFAASDFSSSRLAEECRAVACVLHQTKSLNLFGSVFPVALSLSFAEDLCLMNISVCLMQRFSGRQPALSKEHSGCLVTFSGRLLESSPEIFHEFKNRSQPFICISTRKSVCDEADFGILMPHSVSTEFDNCIYLLILDLILFNIWKEERPFLESVLDR